MHIGWNFLDKRKATIKAIEAYESMDFIVKHTDIEIAEVRRRMEGVSAVKPDGMPHAHDPKAGEKRLIEGIDEIDTLKERYRQATEYMAWFKPAWRELSEEERFLLEAFYMDGDESGAVAAIQERFCIEKTSAYNKKNKALDHMTMLLYGKA